MDGDRVDDAREGVLLQPDLDVGVGVIPQRLAIEPRGLLQRGFDAVERPRLALPAGIVGEPVVGEIARPAHDREVGLHLGVTALGLLDEAAHGGLIEHLAHRHRLAGIDDVKQGFAPCLDLGLGRSERFM